MNFQRKMDNPLSAMGIGQNQLIKKWLDEMGITHYTINDDFIIDVNERVDLSGICIINFPDYIQFNRVNLSFDCEHCGLVSLRGCPIEVGGYFSCIDNELTSLDGCPSYVDGDFYCDDNKTQFTREYVLDKCSVKGDIEV